MTYVSALIAQADPGIVSGSTIERKKMSTKTSFKRIALVAVAGLVSGLVSVAPANAVAAAGTPFGVSAATYAPADSFAATVAVQQVAGALNYVELDADFDAANVVAKVTGSTIISQVQAAGTSPAVGTLNTAATEITWSNSNLEDTTDASFRVGTPTAGTITVVIATRATSNGVVTDTTLQTFTITVGPAVTNVYSAANSTVLASGDGTDQGAATPSTTTDAAALATAPTILASSAATVEALMIVVDQEDANDVNLSTPVKNEVTITGVGSVGIAVATPLGSYATETAQGSDFYIFADGRAGQASVEVKVNGVVVKTYKVIFAGAAASYTATQELIVTGNGTETTDAILVAAKDSANNGVSGHTIYAFSSDTTIATVETSDATEATAIATSGTIPTSYVAATPIGSVAFSVTGLAGKSGTVTITLGNASTVAASTIKTTILVKVGAVAATKTTLTLNKATYLPGEAVTATLTFLDASNNPIAAGPGTAALAAALAVTNGAGQTIFATAVPTKLGTATATFYAPLLNGTFTVTGKTGASGTYVASAGADATVTASAAVAAPANAEIATLTTLVNSLIAKINALNKLVIKIQKKVRA
jgi:hypothetical protein